jgi:hypothetical protein
MEPDKIQHLLNKYHTGTAGPRDVKEIESLIEQGEIQLADIEGFALLENRISEMETPVPSTALDERFRSMLKQEAKGIQAPGWKKYFTWTDLTPRLALAAVTLLAGLVIGYLLRSPAEKDEHIVQLGLEISQLKEMMMLSLLEKESATDRLKAVNLTQDMDQVSKKVTSALLQTLNSDENPNVRLAALDALRPYSKDSQIREALIRSIAQQKSPLVQLALAELMVQLQEKGAIRELNKILKDSETPADIKKKIQESIQVI